ncbi:hypothetical protein PHYSODRAFT_293195 [Phytophthora sojae]|uniref:Uncharacterized protein n=1 Tax=Phytophthora sojae (strain P6497) TaxID=1094619 RepID=G4YK11_PHYSP|nr:hypothetical protein PHYSODRAFT_293195 [Phytophthora sojae]EGZ27143.1 hypothetical protein PHYSODRAFT_293195 [Phytophthora sojae]|eukprot:XP_009514418.1 hypothetical protein PHYSODRAFT_293195 [Phytophthora sojae]
MLRATQVSSVVLAHVMAMVAFLRTLRPDQARLRQLEAIAADADPADIDTARPWVSMPFHMRDPVDRLRFIHGFAFVRMSRIQHLFNAAKGFGSQAAIAAGCGLSHFYTFRYKGSGEPVMPPELYNPRTHEY